MLALIQKIINILIILLFNNISVVISLILYKFNNIKYNILNNIKKIHNFYYSKNKALLMH